MSSSSMSVHSLIDKFSQQEQSRQHPRPDESSGYPGGQSGGIGSSSGSGRGGSTGDAPSVGSGSSRPTGPASGSFVPPPLSYQQPPQFKLTSPQISPQPPQLNSGLLALLGPDVQSFPYSEQAYMETIKLRAEQERAKQDYYKLEIANKNLAILQMAIQAQIPVHLIPSMCVGSSDLQVPQIPPQSSTNVGSTASPTPIPKHAPETTTTTTRTTSTSSRPVPGPVPVPIPEKSGHSRTPSRELNRPDALSASPVPPMSYRFGGGPVTASSPKKVNRPLSPAKIGAVAVANLATPTTPYRTRRGHQRYYSMPTESYIRSPGRSIDLNRIPESGAKYRQQMQQLSSGMLQPPRNQPSNLSSPQGATSQIYVKPAPAQPLHAQTKQAQPPSQESMTSLQHVISFHHWKPEDGGSGSGHQPPSTTHKRHKSHSENMSIDMKQEKIDEDVSMDTSMVTEKEEREIRYPNILSPERN
ncbi:hypothetical protein CAAN1_09S04016 [[Candida] anglica]|uniref:Uncharacterized protein n=1 Tax=[Candida] anglica TaxID=148631 RepID=A0ABP0EGE4_9ASCO